MSSINNVKIYGLEESIVASGYPMATQIIYSEELEYCDEKDYKRANKLATTPIGSGHDQFLTSIIVQFDLTFPLKAWVELQRYQSMLITDTERNPMTRKHGYRLMKQ